MNAPLPTFAFVAALAQIRERLVDRFPLAPVAIAPELTHAEGQLHGQAVVVDAEVLRGGPLARARFATVRGAGLEIASICCIADPELALPTFGADLVTLGPRRALVAMDLSPSVPELADIDLAGLAAWRERVPVLPSAGALPSWCASVFSTHHVFARPEPEHAEQVRATLLQFTGAFVELLAAASPRARHVEQALAGTRRYLHAHREDDKSAAVLTHAFGARWAARFRDEVLFPEELT